ncbi:hypothetical protein EI555_010737, partial [Monodon monoceros]
DLSHLPSSWALPFGTQRGGRQGRLEKRTQASLFQPRRQRAPLSTPGPLPHWVSVCEGVEPVGGVGGGRGGRTTEDRSPHTAPVATFAASPVCPEPAPGLTVSILPHLPWVPALASLVERGLQQGSKSLGKSSGFGGDSVSYKMGSELETAMETLINVFHAHSGKEGDKYKLSKKELKELLQTELSGFLDAQKDADAVDKVMKELDENGDGEVDFQEYVVLVAALTVACNNFFWENS